ncbi:G1 family glutamic endopeptidase [Alicyclobacillus sendaiensis]|uniref:Peptidase A4 family protein n=2 Tax=Alicyclobacillus vulcanalis TaxID=252246 RepID=A0A1N7JW11_9BACL|nr:G1 family glutamic endopeptidase [Alicyclobacillus sendaiensis]SIS53394.1 Peptidase A4 family protein [Alicyclobacillus vulcanalis]
MPRRMAQTTVLAVAAIGAFGLSPARCADTGVHGATAHGRAASIKSALDGASPENIDHGALSIADLGWATLNWSGYALTQGRYWDISGSWVVPSVSPSPENAYSSTWIGIDGFSNDDLIQIGTEQNDIGGKPQDFAWWEIRPVHPTEVIIPWMHIAPGDAMYARIERLKGTRWALTLDDLTQGEQFTLTQTYTGPGASAEWIQEAPEIHGRVSTLADYGTVTFVPGTVNGRPPVLRPSEGGYMANDNLILSVPSAPNPETEGFEVFYVLPSSHREQSLLDAPGVWPPPVPRLEP